MGVARQWQIFGMMREGYEKLFRLAGEDGEWLDEHVNGSQSECGVGIHVRHGDRHPFEFQYSESYVPLGKYIEAAEEMSPAGGNIVVASDDPDVYLSREMADAGIERAQARIILASKKTLGNGGLGWEGGFFANVFRSLGLPPELQRTERSRGTGPRPSRGRKMMESGGAGEAEVVDTYAHPPPEALRLREYVARAYLLDLAVLGGCGRVVCAVSSATCRVLGVMVGWEGVSSGEEEGGAWRNVDGAWGWRVLDW